MICHLFHALEGHNWTPVASADVSAKYISPQNGDDIPMMFISMSTVYSSHMILELQQHRRI